MNNKQKDTERKHFDELAENIGEAWWGHLTPAGQKRLERRANIIKENTKQFKIPRILEIGCGAGALSKYLLEHLPPCEMVCCDLSPASIRLAKDRCTKFQGVSFEIEDVTCLTYPTESFDIIVGNSILHHVPTEITLKECYRLLRPEGVIVFFEPNMLNPQIAIEKNVKFIGKIMQNTPDERAFTRWEIKKLLSKTGFTNIRVEPFDFLHPGIPSRLIPFMERLGYILEKFPALKEISGSLKIFASKKKTLES